MRRRDRRNVRGGTRRHHRPVQGRDRTRGPVRNAAAAVKVSRERERSDDGLRRTEHGLRRAAAPDQLGGTADPDGRQRHTPVAGDRQNELPR